jgi:hypothetical protein
VIAGDTSAGLGSTVPVAESLSEQIRQRPRHNASPRPERAIGPPAPRPPPSTTSIALSSRASVPAPPPRVRPFPRTRARCRSTAPPPLPSEATRGSCSTRLEAQALRGRSVTRASEVPSPPDGRQPLGRVGQVASVLFAMSSDAAVASLSSTSTRASPESMNGKAPPASSALIDASIPADASRP